MKIKRVGEGKVYLIAGGGRTYSDMAAKFCRSKKSTEEIIASPQDLKLLETIVNSPHKAVLEFDDFIFGIEGYSRVAEVQLVRKRHASYMIKSGRAGTNGKNTYILPKNKDSDFMQVNGHISVDAKNVFIRDSDGNMCSISNKLDVSELTVNINTKKILELIDDWYACGLTYGIKEEDLRYLKPQATEFRACVKMNACALRDWFQIRMCNRAQEELRDLAFKMFKCCNATAPELFAGAGPSCVVLGYCPEPEQCLERKGIVPTKKEALKILKEHYQR